MLRAATARCFAGKLGAQSDRVLNAVMNDRMVAKGLVLHWATAFFVDFLATEPMDDLVAILRKLRAWLKLLGFGLGLQPKSDLVVILRKVRSWADYLRSRAKMM